ncbi:hypothetical protein AURDEDRAFT_178225, partial [Auricularia subglabra TFB-10046 SS5]
MMTPESVNYRQNAMRIDDDADGDSFFSESTSDTRMSYGTPIGAGGEQQAESMMVRESGEWSREEFGRRILDAAAMFGDDLALATMLNTFPRIDLADARLWLTYLKNAGSGFDA